MADPRIAKIAATLNAAAAAASVTIKAQLDTIGDAARPLPLHRRRAARSHRAERLQRDIDRLVRQIARERHFKRKVDLRREVRDARAELERLMESPMGASATDEG